MNVEADTNEVIEILLDQIKQLTFQLAVLQAHIKQQQTAQNATATSLE